MLGRNYKRVLKDKDKEAAARRNASGSGPASIAASVGSRQVHDGAAQQEEEDDEEEEGRASLVGKKEDSKKGKTDSGPGQPGTSEVEDAQHGDGSKAAPGGRGRKKKATSFLDEVLAERSKKRKKR